MIELGQKYRQQIEFHLIERRNVNTFFTLRVNFPDHKTSSDNSLRAKYGISLSSITKIFYVDPEA